MYNSKKKAYHINLIIWVTKTLRYLIYMWKNAIITEYFKMYHQKVVLIHITWNSKTSSKIKGSWKIITHSWFSIWRKKIVSTLLFHISACRSVIPKVTTWKGDLPDDLCLWLSFQILFYPSLTFCYSLH